MHCQEKHEKIRQSSEDMQREWSEGKKAAQEEEEKARMAEIAAVKQKEFDEARAKAKEKYEEERIRREIEHAARKMAQVAVAQNAAID